MMHFYTLFLIELYIFPHFHSFLSSPLPPSSLPHMLPIYSGELVFISSLGYPCVSLLGSYLLSSLTLFLCVQMFCLNVWCLWRPEAGIRSPETGATDSSELPRRCWKSNWSPLKEHPVFLSVEPSFQCPNSVFLF